MQDSYFYTILVIKKGTIFINLQIIKRYNRMKVKNLYIKAICLLLFAINLYSCGVDRWSEYAVQTAKDEWIYNVMSENYLWNYTLPSSNSVNFFTAPAAFLQSILFKEEDNNYSKVDTFYNPPLPSYGFDYILQKSNSNDTAYYALVSYVLPDSPASEVDLKRGDWIMTVNNQVMTKANADELLAPNGEIELAIGKYETIEATDSTRASWTVVKTATAAISAARSVPDNPVHYYTTVTTPMGIKVGYLVYSEFLAGTKNDPELYNKMLLDMSNEFYQERITHFVLDLRYNTGGSFANTQLLASILAPSGALGSDFASLIYNEKNTSKNKVMTYDASLIAGGANLNIQQGFIITSSATSPSVAGSFLNCLSPLQRWALIGSNLSCWGVAAEQYINENLSWAVSPIVCYVENSEKETGQTGVFKPNVSIAETKDLSTFLPFGNPKETILSTIIDLIDN